MRERSPVRCAQPSPRRDAPSPLAFAKSCKGGDVSVLDPALAWDDRFIYLFIRGVCPPIPPLGCLFSFFLSFFAKLGRLGREQTRPHLDPNMDGGPLNLLKISLS